MNTLIYKQLNLKIFDNPKVNHTMKQRGTLNIYINLECQKVKVPDLLNCDEYDGDYILKWSSTFNEESPELVTKEQKSDLMDFLLNSYFDEEQVFNSLSEDVEYELNYLDKYNVAYHLKNDVAKVEALLLLVSRTIIKNGADTKSLDTDGVNELVELMREAINIHEGNDEVSD